MSDHSEDIGYLKGKVDSIENTLTEYKPKFDSVLEYIAVQKAQAESKQRWLSFKDMTISGIVAAAAGSLTAFLMK